MHFPIFGCIFRESLKEEGRKGEKEGEKRKEVSMSEFTKRRLWWGAGRDAQNADFNKGSQKRKMLLCIDV